MHLVQDVAEFSGETPGRLLAAVETAYRVTLDGAAVERAVGVPGGAAVYDVTSSCIVEGREE
ncbi:MAG TPA: hypothetical protein VFV95_02600 [Vicinamibacterales bacterium]|nr:hypothetical protein [Vicinamibacterales bacterium]